MPQPNISDSYAELIPGKPIPQHIGIIMDGNGRWAKSRGLPRAAGHRAGTKNIRRLLEEAVRIGVKVLTIYAFSTENWGRPRAEVGHLMRLISQSIRNELDELHANGVQIRHSGRLAGVEPALAKQIQSAIERTKENDTIVLNVAFNYGGRAEIVDAIKNLIQDGIALDDVSEELVSRYLYTAGLPDPDIIVRTGGEYRLSNFLTWQAAYAEYYATPTYWPDFDEAALREAIAVFQGRDRRYGLVR
ncbi:MAG: di-trans,poly-cis-decaprenylcistransferase [Chloroflexi bacterium]|nr:di-trans,poly-cis-decaprenylcistransferase [Chloroflexota bacterium]